MKKFCEFGARLATFCDTGILEPNVRNGRRERERERERMTVRERERERDK